MIDGLIPGAIREVQRAQFPAGVRAEWPAPTYREQLEKTPLQLIFLKEKLRHDAWVRAGRPHQLMQAIGDFGRKYFPELKAFKRFGGSIGRI